MAMDSVENLWIYRLIIMWQSTCKAWDLIDAVGGIKVTNDIDFTLEGFMFQKEKSL